ncbi:hypothetical protein CRP01_34310 [Flavilitoribacter nigricans DSM 23189 = NBRC 102662]|uniref:Uncharacterized protein n=1 Tax=Flavilitoribacter nigricans (strain ATCC 23147 / DSM 23189 / NBRC 102662 / NCIMB 1420 / SS-2) TaxID=1122177 RepID=A0A2D0N0D0_FLAN2|nr:hypothetical protein CRP01_34310 [Flavilitoribacter nigricans DSM 23189 = NBRC 102662]
MAVIKRSSLQVDYRQKIFRILRTQHNVHKDNIDGIAGQNTIVSEHQKERRLTGEALTELRVNNLINKLSYVNPKNEIQIKKE